MASCVFSRVDSRTTSTSQPKFSSRLIADGTDILLAFIDYGAGANPGSIRFARFSTVSLTTTVETSISGDYAFSNQVAALDMVQLDDGRLIAAWYSASTIGATGNACSASESADEGATWSAPINISSVNKGMHGLMTDGTTVWMIANSIGGGGVGGSGDVISHKRTAVATWAAGINVYDSVADTPGGWDVTRNSQARICGDMSSALVGFMVGTRATDAGIDSKNLSCLYTTDGWATATRVNLQTFTANSGGLNIDGVRLASGRYYIMTHNNDSSAKITLYYTDNDGAAWTAVGIPTAYSSWLTLNGLNGDGAYDSFLCLDALENLLIGQSSQNSIPPGLHSAFRSGAAPTGTSGWSQVGECAYLSPDVVDPSTAGRGIVIGTTLYRLVGMARSLPPDYYTLQFLSVADAGVPVETEGESPVADSDAFDNNLYLRNNLAEPGGDSAHLFPVAYFMDWDEGDTETGREVPIILAASPSMDPAIQDPTLIPGFTRVSDPGSWTTRGYVSDGTNIQTVHDPLQFRVTTPQYTIDKEFNRNVARGALIAWVLNGASEPTVSVWVDGKLNHVIRLYDTFGKKEERFFPLPTFNNVGSEIQYVVEDLSPFFFSIETLGVKLKPKGIRG